MRTQVAEESGAPTEHKSGWYRWLVLSQVVLFLLSAYLLSDLLHRWLDQPVAGVEVTGDLVNVDGRHVQRRILGYTGLRYVELPLDRIRADLEENPWIERVDLYRRWPQVLEVHISENTPVARWGELGLINESGRVFMPDDMAQRDEFQGLPRLVGPEDRARELMRQYRDFSRLLRPVQLRLQSLELEPRGAWSAVLNNGIKLRIGRERVVERMQRFVTLYQGQLGDFTERIHTIDVRYTNGLAVVWKTPPTRRETQ